MAFSADLKINDEVATIDLSGELDASVANEFKTKVEEVASTPSVKRLVLNMEKLEYMASAGLRVLIFAKQKMGTDISLDVISPQDMVLDTLKKAGLHHSVNIIE